MDVNVNGVLYTAQAAGRQMARFGNGGSIILIASMSGSITNMVCTSSQASLSLRCAHPLIRTTVPKMGIVQHVQVCGEADGTQHGVRARCTAHPRQHPQPGLHLHHVRPVPFLPLFPITATVYHSRLTGLFLDSQPGLLEKWSSQNPTGRLGRPDELRGVVAWLASDASTYCTGSECVWFLAVLPLRVLTTCVF